MLFLVSSTGSDVAMARKHCLEVILCHKLRHFPLKTGCAAGNTKGETCKLASKAVYGLSSFLRECVQNHAIESFWSFYKIMH